MVKNPTIFVKNLFEPSAETVASFFPPTYNACMPEIKIAKSAGFCWGVKRAIDITLQASRNRKKRIFTFGPLIHNPQLIELLNNKKIHTISDYKHIEQSDIIIRTHGITPDIRSDIRKAGHHIIDATCPLVARVQGMIKKFSGKGYAIVIVGDEGHAEIVGLKGFVKTSVHVISGKEEVSSLPAYEKVFVAAQTTCDRKRYSEAVKELQKKYPTLEVGDTICEATYTRQDEVIALANEVDLVIVVGGENSANTKRLADIARQHGAKSIRIETELELSAGMINGHKSIGVTAGASTPQWLVERVVHKLQKLAYKGGYRFFSLAEAMRFLTKSNLLLAFSGAGLAYINMRIMDVRPTLPLAAVSFFAVLATYLSYQLLNASNLMISDHGKYQYHARFKKIFWSIALFSAVAGGAISFHLGVWQGLLFMALVLVGATYRADALTWKMLAPVARLKDIPGSKDIFAATAWGVITVIIPYLSAEKSPELTLPLVYTFGLIYVRSLLFELRDVKKDQVVGREVLPVLFGVQTTSLVVYGILFILSLVLAGGYILGIGDYSLLVMLAGLFIMCWFVYYSMEGKWRHSTRFDLFLDAYFLSVALMVLAIDSAKRFLV